MPTMPDPDAAGTKQPVFGPSPDLIVFTDLDGTLLRHEDYDWSPASAAIAELKRRNVPLVIATSKTRAEIEYLRERIGNQDPFISENGGALYIPLGSTPRPIGLAVPKAGYMCVRFGANYARLRGCLKVISYCKFTTM